MVGIPGFSIPISGQASLTGGPTPSSANSPTTYGGISFGNGSAALAAQTPGALLRSQPTVPAQHNYTAVAIAAAFFLYMVWRKH